MIKNTLFYSSPLFPFRALFLLISRLDRHDEGTNVEDA